MINELMTVEIEARKHSEYKIAEGFYQEALHRYTDIHGNVIYWRIRLKHADGRKWIRPMYQDARGQFRLSEPPQNQSKLLYGLHYIALYPDALIYIVEGEYPADCLNHFFEKQSVLGRYVAITSGSATSCDAADWQPLTGRSCVIWPDNDAPGEGNAKQVNDKLKQLKCNVDIIDARRLNLTEGGDCVDWLRENKSATINDLISLHSLAVCEEAAPTEDDDAIRKLASLSPLEYDRRRIAVAKAMGIRQSTLDSMVEAERADSQNEDSLFPEVEPWQDPINPANLLTDIFNIIKRFIVCQEETVIAATLWAAMTWFIDVIQVAPLAVITAPEKRCGKSQMLFLLSRIVNRPLAASNISPAALYRSIDAWRPTLLIDEVDTFMRENVELRGLINCGHTRESAYSIRSSGEDFAPRVFYIWGAKALAGIGKLADTIIDRSITLELRRKRPEESVERLRHAEPDLFKVLAKKLARFAHDYSERIRNAKPHLPDFLNDRAQDNWEPLFAIAETAGVEWLRRAHAAALKLSSDAEPKSIGVELLSDIQEIIETLPADRISSADLIAALCKDEEKSWSTYNRGHPISPRQLASRLREFGIISQTIRLGITTAKGYLFLQFADAFNRYLSVNVTTSQAAM